LSRVRRQFAVLFGGRPAQVGHVAAQLQELRLVSDGADGSAGRTAARLGRQLLQSVLLDADPRHRLLELRTVVQHVFAGRDQEFRGGVFTAPRAAGKRTRSQQERGEPRKRRPVNL